MRSMRRIGKQTMYKRRAPKGTRLHLYLCEEDMPYPLAHDEVDELTKELLKRAQLCAPV